MERMTKSSIIGPEVVAPDGCEAVFAFDSWGDFLEYINAHSGENAPTDAVTQRPGRAHFTGVHDFAAFQSLARDGWLEGAREFSQGPGFNVRAPESHSLITVRAFTPKWATRGSVNVPRSLAGRPNAFRLKTRTNKQTIGRTVRIVVDLGVSADTNKDSQSIIGREVFRILEALALAGVSAEVLVSVSNRSTLDAKKRFSTIVKVADNASATDPARIAFAVGHQSMLRMGIFRVWETAPDEMRRRYGMGARLGNYGGPVGADTDSLALLGSDSLAIPSPNGVQPENARAFFDSKIIPALRERFSLEIERASE